MKTKLLLIVSLMLCACSVQAKSLWGKTKAGMTVDAVKAAYPAAYVPAGKDSVKGALERLALDGVELADTKFRARFFFKNDKLSNVMLTLDQTFSHVGSGWSVYDSIKNALTSKYGDPVDVENKDTSLMKAMSADWVVGDTSISIIYLSVGKNDETPTLNVAYKTISKTIDNL